MGYRSLWNFESIFSDLHKSGAQEKLAVLERSIEQYFEGLSLPDSPTIYDHLVLSLRNTDLIATFNWDPLLMQAYVRNQASGLDLPRLAFLHGNVLVGYCEEHRICGLVGRSCPQCGTVYKKTPLLYPVEKKDYAKDAFITNEWRVLRRGFENAFMITIFGYSGPRTDEEALSAMRAAWGNKNKREFEQTAFIVAPTQKDAEVSAAWDAFIHTHHYEIDKSFYDSWIAYHPRRTGEAWWNQYLECKFLEDNPIPRELSFEELWNWYRQFKPAEDRRRAEAAS